MHHTKISQWRLYWYVRVPKQTITMTMSGGKKCRSPTKCSNNIEAGHASCKRLSSKVTLERQRLNHLPI